MSAATHVMQNIRSGHSGALRARRVIGEILKKMQAYFFIDVYPGVVVPIARGPFRNVRVLFRTTCFASI